MEVHPKLTQQTEQELLTAQQNFLQAGGRSATQIVNHNKMQKAMPIKEKKQSLFARKMGLVRKDESKDTEAVITTVREKNPEELQILTHHYEIPQTGFPSTFKLNEQDIHISPQENTNPLHLDSEEHSIHQQNIQKIQTMSPEEYQQNLQEIYDTIDPNVISVLKARGLRKLKPVQPKPTKELVHVENNPEVLKSNIPTAASVTCAHSSAPPTSQFDMYRFDSDANITQKYQKDHWEGTDAGYSITEWASLIRSTLPSQRSLSLLTLKTLLLSSLPFPTHSALNFLIEKCSISVSLRYSLDDKNINVQSSALYLLHTILTQYNLINYKIQDLDGMIFPTIISPSSNVLLSSDQRNFKEIWEEELTRHDFSQDTEDANDDELCQLDLIGGLIRMGLLERLYHIITDINIQEVLEILTACAMHSVTACYAIVRTKDLVDKVMSMEYKEFKLFRLLSILSKASLSIAYVIKKYSSVWIPAIFNKVQQKAFDISADTLDLVASQLLYIKEFAIDNMWEIYLDLSQNIQNDDGLARCWCVVKRSYILTKTPEVYRGFVEISMYRYMHNIQQVLTERKYCTIAQIAEFLKHVIHTIKDKKTHSSSEEYQQIIIHTLTGIQICTEHIQWTLPQTHTTESCDSIRRLDQYFTLDWEDNHRPLYSALSSLISLCICLELTSADTSSLNELFKAIIPRVLSLVIHILEIFRYSERLNPIVLYRFQDLQSIMISYLQFSDSSCEYYKSCVYYSFLMLFSYSEYTLEFLLSKLPNFSSVPYYRGFINTDKHLDYSTRYTTSSKSLPSYFLCNKETQYLPLPFNWAFLPLISESSDLLSYIEVCREYICTLSSLPLYLIIQSINQLFMRNDLNLNGIEPQVLELLREVVGKSEFSKAFKNVRENIMLVVKHYCAESYCDRLYSVWIVSLYQKCEIDSLKRCIEDEMGPLLSRAIAATEGIFLT